MTGAGELSTGPVVVRLADYRRQAVAPPPAAVIAAETAILDQLATPASWARWALAPALAVMGRPAREALMHAFDALDDKTTQGVRDPAQIMARLMAHHVAAALQFDPERAQPQEGSAGAL